MVKKTRFIDLIAFNVDVNIAALASLLGYDLKKQGSTFVSPCPNCKDTGTKRHLTFYPKTNSYVCHKCNTIKGNNFNLIKNTLSLDNKGTIDWIKDHSHHFSLKYADRLNSFLRPQARGPILDNELSCPWSGENVSDISREIYRAFYSMLDLPDQIRDYLTRKRGLNDDTINRFQIKGIYRNNRIIATKLKKNFKIDDLLKSGIFVKNAKGYPYLTFWTDCVLFPHFYADDPIYFSGRYINHSIRFSNLKGQPKRFFNLDSLNNHEVIYVTEGIMNALSLYQLEGKDNFMATLGIIPDNQAAVLRSQFPSIDFRFVYDPDKAGLASAPNLKADPQFYLKLFQRFGFDSIPAYLYEGLPGKEKVWDVNDLLAWLTEKYEERAAILEYDHKLTRNEAERQAQLEIEALGRRFLPP